MRQFSFVWLFSLVGIVNLSRWPTKTLGIIIICGLVLSAFWVPRTRIPVAAMLFAIATTCYTFLQLAGHQLQAHHISTDLQVTIRIDSVPERYDRRLSFVAKVLDCHSCIQPLMVDRVQLSWYGAASTISAGELWQLTIRLKPPTAYRNKGSFDAIAFSLLKGIQARGYVRDKEVFTKSGEVSVVSLAAIRQAAAAKLKILATDTELLGLLQGLSVGVKSNIGQEQWEVLRNTGTAHLLAISGLHIGLIAGWALVVSRFFNSLGLRWIQQSYKANITFDSRPLTLLFSFTAAVIYAALAGFELPTQRAVLMLGVWLIASLRFRFLPPMAALCVALVIVLLANNLNVLSAGFWLSFGTVFMLFFLHRGHIREHPVHSSTWQKNALLKLGSIGRTHALLGMALLPVSAWFFQSGSLIAPFANLLAVPWVALVCVPLSLLTLVFAVVFEPLAIPIMELASGSLEILMWYLTILDGLPVSSVVLTVPGNSALVFSLLALLIIFAPGGLGVRWFVLPLMLPLIVHNASIDSTQRFQVHVLDVGQGLAVLIYTDRQTTLFDTGGRLSSNKSMFEAVVVPFLHATGRRRIDTLVVSHSDEDHAYGVKDVLSRFPNVRVYASQPLQLPGSASQCIAGQRWSVGIVEFAFIHPAEADTGSANDLSCVLIVYSGRSRVLLTGDIEASAEQTIIGRMKTDSQIPVTLMTAPHHGSRSSSTLAFVRRMRPEFVVYPAGLRNRYGFPHRDVQLRYKLVGAEAFVTGSSGSVSFNFGPDGLLGPPVSWWNSHRRFWHGIVNPDCWRKVAGQSLILRLHRLMQEGKTLCGK